MRALTSASCSGWPVSLSTNMASGEPQARWRLISQSGRLSTMERMRLRPGLGIEGGGVDGVQRRLAQGRAAVAASSSGSSMRMNHCGVLRKITGALERQECG